jgi:hypothetical protein
MRTQRLALYPFRLVFDERGADAHGPLRGLAHREVATN